MKKMMVVALFVLAIAGMAMAQTYTEGAGITGIDKLAGHQNGGRGCVGCHTPHSGAWGNGGNAITDTVTDAETGNVALFGQDLGPLYGQTFETGGGDFDITLPADVHGNESEVTGVMMCLSCHDGNIAKGAMMANQSYLQKIGKLPASYANGAIPTLLGADGTTAGNYKNDHPIGPAATLGAVGVASRLTLVAAATGTCQVHGVNVDCLQPNTANAQFMAFVNNYGAFNITQKTATNPSGGRTPGVVIPSGGTAAQAYVVCTTCHTPHSSHTWSGVVRNNTTVDVDPVAAGVQTTGVYPTYFFVAAPYNPAAPITDGTKASSATQFCRQCHFTGAGGSNEGSNIMGINTSF